MMTDEKREKRRSINRRWYLSHAESIKANARKQYAENPEKYKQISRERNKKNPEKKKDVGKKWREKNREKVNAASRRRYHLHHPIRICKTFDPVKQQEKNRLLGRTYYQKNRRILLNKKHRMREVYRNAYREKITTLSDHYVKRQIRRSLKLSNTTISCEMISTWRLILLAKRKLRAEYSNLNIGGRS